MTQLQFNDIYGYFRKKNDHGLPQWLESDETITSPDQAQSRVPIPKIAVVVRFHRESYVIPTGNL